MMQRLVFFILFAFALKVASAQTTVTSRLDTTKAIVGQTVGMEVKIVQAPETEVFWPLLNDSIGGVDLINTGTADTQKTSDQQLLITRRYVLMAFDSGSFVIPPLTFNVRSPKGNADISTNPLRLEVFLMPVDTTKAIKDIAPLVEVPYDWLNLLLIILGVILLAAIVYWLYKRYTGKKEVVEVAKELKRTPHEIALEELEKLRVAGLWQQGRVKIYYTELTDILRRYISARWNINAMELTSDEILSSGFVRLLGNEKKHLVFILQMADLVKFAKALPLPADHENCLAGAVEFVKASIPVPVTELKEEAKS